VKGNATRVHAHVHFARPTSHPILS
jgi:hypothetical protein